MDVKGYSNKRMTECTWIFDIRILCSALIPLRGLFLGHVYSVEKTFPYFNALVKWPQVLALVLLLGLVLRPMLFLFRPSLLPG